MRVSLSLKNSHEDLIPANTIRLSKTAYSVFKSLELPNSRVIFRQPKSRNVLWAFTMWSLCVMKLMPGSALCGDCSRRDE